LTLERGWLLATARAEREALGRTIQYTPPEAWDQESSSPGWRNRDIVGHLAAAEVVAAAAMAAETAAELEEYLKGREGTPFRLDDFNQWTVERRAEQPFRSVVREWGSAADLFLSRAAQVPPEEWATRRVTWTDGCASVLECPLRVRADEAFLRQRSWRPQPTRFGQASAHSRSAALLRYRLTRASGAGHQAAESACIALRPPARTAEDHAERVMPLWFRARSVGAAGACS